ncbi:imelysin family protein [Microvirga pudoricolor]|uniref:imelysin family protein n=1 Tax=Microvirga pudoricolor TaxID=2778729 RepID=UPI00194E6DE1|nr:imelysin family protein [Microvirga pudoricolor]MBM6593337.1 imelysin family protein [Microvirga pudoricolor]
MLRLRLILALIFSTLAFPSLADNRAAIVQAARDFIVPRYEVLAQTTQGQNEAWKGFCAAPRADAIGSLRDAYNKAADAWSGIEFVLYGPVSTDFRFERMAHWPERKNAVTRALGNLLSRTGTDDLSPERFAGVSAAAQGFTAIERLLYEQNAARLLSDSSETAKRRCAVGQAIAAGLARTSEQVLDEWRRPSGTLAQLETGDAARVEEAATRLATDYTTLFEIIDDQKLGAVMGKSADEAKPTLAEGWRSGRSMQAIRVNLEAAEALARQMLDPGDSNNSSLFYGLESARSIAANLPDDIGASAENPKRRRQLILLRDAVHSLRETAAATLPAALGITMGFNSRDGD